MDLLGFLFGALVLASGAFLFERNKRQSAEAINQNLDTKEDLLKKSEQQNDLKAKEELETLLRTLIDQEKEKDKNAPVKPKDFN